MAASMGKRRSHVTRLRRIPTGMYLWRKGFNPDGKPTHFVKVRVR